MRVESGGGREGESFGKVGRRWGGVGLVWFVVYRILFSIVVVAVVGLGRSGEVCD